MVLSKFDTLPPELIVEISDYLDGCDLYYALYGLNKHIDAILDQQCHRLRVSFTRISKIKFDLFCNRILPRIGDRIVSLILCGDNSSMPGQLALFLSHFNSLATVFVKLESFKLIDFTKSNVEILLPHFSALIHLKYLSIGDYKRLMPIAVRADELFNENVPLPISLRNLAFPYEVSNEWMQTSSTTISLVEQLHAHFIHMNALPSFLQRFPYLKHLTAVLSNINQDNLQIDDRIPSKITFNTLKYLNVNITQDVVFEDFAWLLRSVPQLHSLSVEALNPNLAFLEAHRWEEVLPAHLFSFCFDLTMTLPTNPDHVELLEPFKSKFWVSRGWLVECRLRDHGRFFRLSTIRSPIITILYWPDDEVLLNSAATPKYSNVMHIELWWNLSMSTQAICPNVRSIQLYGASNDRDEPFHSTVCQILQCPSLEHIIINDTLPITQIRFASVLAKSSENVRSLTCSVEWLFFMLDYKDYAWICLLVTMRIRKFVIAGNENVPSNSDLIAFCRTFINLEEITMKMESIQDFLFIVNTLGQLTMVNIELPSVALDNINDITEWLKRNTILLDFIAHKQTTALNTCKIILWIGSRRTSNPLITENALYLNYPFINQRINESLV